MKKIAVIQSQSIVDKQNPQERFTAGGTQRYTVQLAKLLRNKGYEVYIIGRSNKTFVFKYDNNNVIIVEASQGIRGNIRYSKYVYDYCQKMKPTFVCYVDLMVGKYYCYQNSLTLDHGIGWDGPITVKSRIKRYIYNKQYIKTCRKYKKIVCVDTNFINYMRQNDSHFFENPSKFEYIPNFADEDMFKYQKKTFSEQDELVLLYPRRLVFYRGYELFIEMCEMLKQKGYNIKPVLAFEESHSDTYTKLFENTKCQYEIVHPSLNEIFKQYHRAFITYVPTIWSEGTSLSAIEAICSGCPVITSNVGGLGNIVIPGFVGEIVSPTVDEFVKATEKVLNNPEIRDRWAENCKYVRDSFSTSAWNIKMNEIIKQFEKT